MREKKPCLIFPISNSPLASVDNKNNILSHEYFCESEEDLKPWIKKVGGYKILGPFPEKSQLFVGKYDGDKLEVFRTKTTKDPDPQYPHRLKISELVCDGFVKSPLVADAQNRAKAAGCFDPQILKQFPHFSFTKVNSEIFFGSPMEDSWKVFKELAWFQDICCSLPAMIDKNDKEIREVKQWASFYDDARVALEFFKTDISSLLRTVSCDPDVLRDDKDVLEAYIDFRKCMRGDYGKHKALAMRREFGSHGIPGKNKPSRHKQNLAMSLLGELAKYLNDVCRSQPATTIKGLNDSQKELTTDQYKKIISWAKNRDARIAAFSLNELSSLLFNTEPYLKTFLGKGFGYSKRRLRDNYK